MHFFKLAQELGERPVELQKKLAGAGIAVRSTSTMLDDDTAVKIREYLRRESAAAAATTTVSPAPAPVEVAAPEVPTAPPATPAVPASTTAPTAPVAPPAPAASSPAAPAAPTSAPAPAEARPVTRIIKRVPGVEGQPATQRSEIRTTPAPPRPGQPGQPGPRKPRQSLLTPENDGGLSPDADFGIVKAAGIVPLPQARPERPPRRPMEGDQQRGPYTPRPQQPGGAPGGFRPRGPMGGGPPPMGNQPLGGAPPGLDRTAGKGPGKAPVAGGAAAKKKTKRTVFSEKEKSGLQKRKVDFASTPFRGRRKRRGGHKGGGEVEQFVVEQPVIITGPITVGELAERVYVSPAQIVTQLIGMGVLATVNQQIEPEQAVEVLVKLEFEAMYESTLQEQAEWRLSATTTGGSTVGEIRPPVVTILGHVDHGKTTLLDSIRKTHVTEQEFGGITQHIGAYQVETKGKKITFLDTPGHAAFTAMRARGANLTDIAVLVVAADDGIQPQTIEAIDHAKAAKVPIIVAINKIDVPDAQTDAVKQQLSGHDLVSEEWGGDTIMVPLSAKQGTNIEQLLDMILLVAEVQELRAVADQPAFGAVVESKLDKQRGPLATILIQEGTLHVGDAIVVGMVAGKIRAMADDKGRSIKEAGPSTPVEIMGLSEVPVAGDIFKVVDDERKAREIAEERHLQVRSERLQAHVSLQNLSSMVASGIVKDLNIIVKTDVAGSIEAISQALGQVEHEEIRVNLIHAGVGDVTESDVLLASASNAIIVGFHVKIEQQARLIAEESELDVRIYTVIYDLVDDVQKAMVGMLAPIFEEAILGHAEVRAIFKVSRLGVIAGCYVTDGLLRRGSKIRVKRAGELVYEGGLDSLKHLKDDVREMAQGFECGISVDRYNGWVEGDIIESYIIKERRRETL
ncbi:MAG TPA: translation initiation factor IF-2 [Armatimonadota bacterium]